MNEKESDLRSLILKFKKWIEGSAQAGKRAGRWSGYDFFNMVLKNEENLNPKNALCSLGSQRFTDSENCQASCQKVAKDQVIFRQAKTKAFLEKQKGQISIFMALIFPVLFVFFAMTINIGLLVHDKINLQNSVDLAAYYAAGKQAEILNAIAHLNYQLRQNWKLLAFRIRGFGNFGFTDPLPHPWIGRSTPPYPGDWNPQATQEATICTQHTGWKEKAFRNQSDQTSNLCQKKITTIPAIYVPPLIPGFNDDFNKAINLQTEVFLRDTHDECRHHGTTNWFTGAMWLRAYKKALIVRKLAIKELAEKLRDGKDLLGDEIKDGVQKTFINNLTRSNRKAVVDFKFLNSMEGKTWDKWLIERPISLEIYYTDTECSNTGLSNYTSKQLEILPSHDDVYNNTDFRELKRHLDNIIRDPGPPNFPINYHSIISYEKNPWYMVYAGVSAKISPQEPFSPLVSGNHTLVAKAFAKPFGGRIGPWMFSSWPQGEDKSKGGDLIDKSMELSPTPGTDVIGFETPNYSRFPGDTLGLKSHDSLSIYRDEFFSLSPENKLSYDDFFDESPLIPPDITTSEEKYDPLIWRKNVTTGLIDGVTVGRILEVMAISPDLFDITYYSIDPQFYINHHNISDSKLLFMRLTLDFGARPGDRYNPAMFGVLNQWEWMNDLNKSIIKPADFYYSPVGPAAGWVVKDWRHLLTGWVPPDDDMFGWCDNDGDITKKEEFLPGSCGIGGRMGYSVKLVSKKYLMNPNLPLGGGNNGQIKNQPQGF